LERIVDLAASAFDAIDIPDDAQAVSASVAAIAMDRLMCGAPSVTTVDALDCTLRRALSQGQTTLKSLTLVLNRNDN
jgi:hypothetical protein